MISFSVTSESYFLVNGAEIGIGSHKFKREGQCYRANVMISDPVEASNVFWASFKCKSFEKVFPTTEIIVLCADYIFELSHMSMYYHTMIFNSNKLE